MKRLLLLLILLMFILSFNSMCASQGTTTLKPGSDLIMDSTTPGNIEMNNGNIYNVTELSVDNITGNGRAAIEKHTCRIYANGSNFVAEYENGTVLSTGSSFGNVTNMAISQLLDIVGPGGMGGVNVSDYGVNENASLPVNIYFDIKGAVLSDEPIQLYSFMDVGGPEGDNGFGMGSPLCIYTEDNASIFYTDSSYDYRYISIHNMELINNRSGANYVTVPMIYLNKSGYCNIHNVFVCSNCDFNLNTVSGIIFDGRGETTHFLNKIRDCHLDSLWINNTDNTWIESTQFASWGSTPVSIGVVSSDDIKVLDCHICVPEYEDAVGIYFEGSSSIHSIVDTTFETTTPNSSVRNYGIYGSGIALACILIEGNTFISMGGDIALPSVFSSNINDNIFWNSNYGNSQYSSSIHIEGGSGNNFCRNIGYKPINGIDSYLISGADYNNYDNNIASGYYNDVVVNVGTGSNEDNSLLIS